jgi:transposase-like protein
VSDPLLDRQVRRRLAVLRHVEEVTGNVALTCRYFGISRQLYYVWLRRYRDEGVDGLHLQGSRRACHAELPTEVAIVRHGHLRVSELVRRRPGASPASSISEPTVLRNACEVTPG